MYERFTDRARKVIQLANQEAQRFNHEYIGTEHILLGLVKEGSGVAANVLRNLDVELKKVRLEVEKLIISGPEMTTAGKLPQTPRAKSVIEYAIKESRDLGHNYVGTEHLLLGLLREHEGVAAQILMNLGLNVDDVRKEVINLLGPSKNAAEGPEEFSLTVESRRGARRQQTVDDLPTACPTCGQSRIVRILWNRAHLTGSEQADIEAGRAILGGRTEKDAPSWACLNCAPRWMEVHQLARQDFEWQLAKEEAVALEEWETAVRLRDAQRQLRPRLAALVEELIEH